ncbi:MAG: Fic family protein [Dehalococcoidia bacterium]|nr:Fic family protein [Dehalococcoidia bacterium]
MVAAPVAHKQVPRTMYLYDPRLDAELEKLNQRVLNMRGVGKLGPDVLVRIRQFFRIRNIYNSNAIEGNSLDMGETRLVVEQGLTITGKSMKDQAEAKNLSHALDYLEDLARYTDIPVTANDIWRVHSLILKGLDNDNAGRYRRAPVRISGSAFSPPDPLQVEPHMEEFCSWLESISTPLLHPSNVQLDPIILAAAAHAWFVYIHPFIDGNGRTARILMNLLLMRYSYPIAIITREDRLRYYDALEETQGGDLSQFIGLIYESVNESLEEWESAASEQRQSIEWAQSVLAPLTQQEKINARNEYEVWKSAMDLLKAFYRSSAERPWQTAGGLVNVWFKDFGTLEIEKFYSMSKGESAKQTWFFRLDFARPGRKEARYLFFFGHPSFQLAQYSKVTLHVAQESTPFHYERLKYVNDSSSPDLLEIGYVASEEQFVTQLKNGQIIMDKGDSIAKKFIEQIIPTL